MLNHFNSAQQPHGIPLKCNKNWHLSGNCSLLVKEQLARDCALHNLQYTFCWQPLFEKVVGCVELLKSVPMDMMGDQHVASSLIGCCSGDKRQMPLFMPELWDRG